MVDSDFSSVSWSHGLSVPWSQKKVFTRYIDTENNYIYISDIIISIIYTSLITLGSEIRNQERENFLFFLFIGKKKKKKLPPEPKRRCAGLPRRVLEATMTENSAYQCQA